MRQLTNTEFGEVGLGNGGSPDDRSGRTVVTVVRRTRAKTVSRKSLHVLADRDGDADAATLAEIARTRPRTRADCKDGPRPCPYVSCKFHVFIDASPRTGAIKFNFPGTELWEMRERDTCILDAIERGPLTLDEVGRTMNLVRERVRQIEDEAIRKLRGAIAQLPEEEREALAEGMIPVERQWGDG